MTRSSDRLLRSLVNLFNEHLGLTQVWRMSRAAPFHLRFGARCEHLLVLSGSSLIVLADEVGRWNIAPGGASELGSLHLIRLCDKSARPTTMPQLARDRCTAFVRHAGCRSGRRARCW